MSLKKLAEDYNTSTFTARKELQLGPQPIPGS